MKSMRGGDLCTDENEYILINGKSAYKYTLDLLIIRMEINKTQVQDVDKEKTSSTNRPLSILRVNIRLKMKL